MKYFEMNKSKRGKHYLMGSTNSVYTQVFPDEDFAPQGHWLWIKSPKAHGFGVKVFDRDRIYKRATELIWGDNNTFKRFTRDLPIAKRCVAEGQPGAEIRVADNRFDFYSSCKVYKSNALRTAVNTLDASVLTNVEATSASRGRASCTIATTATRISRNAPTKSSSIWRMASACGDGSTFATARC